MQLKGFGIVAATGAFLLFMAGCASPSSQSGSDREIAPLAPASALSTGASGPPASSAPVAPTKSVPPQTLSSIPGGDPNVDPTFDADIAKQNAYVDAAIARGFDPATLHSVELAASLVAQPTTIAAAGKDAVAIAYGTVKNLEFTNRSTVAQVAIGSIYKGQLVLGSTINVELGCILKANDAYDGLIFGCLPTSPVLLPGESALLLLHPEKIAAPWGAELGTEAFPVSNGRIQPSDPTETLERQVVGLSLEQMLTRLLV